MRVPYFIANFDNKSGLQAQWVLHLLIVDLKRVRLQISQSELFKPIQLKIFAKELIF